MSKNPVIKKLCAFVMLFMFLTAQNGWTTAFAFSSRNASKLQVKGSSIKVFTQDEINTKSINVGDEIICVLDEDWIVDGNLCAPSGSIVKGEVAQMGYSKFHVKFNEIVTPDSKHYTIKTDEIVFDAQLDLAQKTLFVVAYPFVKTVDVLYGSVTEISNGFSYKNSALGMVYVFSGAAPLVGAVKGVRGISIHEEISIPEKTELELKFTANAFLEN